MEWLSMRATFSGPGFFKVTSLLLKQITSQTRCEKCAVILGIHYEEEGVSRTTFHELLKITMLDTVQNCVSFCCPNCGHNIDCILTFVP